MSIRKEIEVDDIQGVLTVHKNGRIRTVVVTPTSMIDAEKQFVADRRDPKNDPKDEGRRSSAGSLGYLHGPKRK